MRQPSMGRRIQEAQPAFIGATASTGICKVRLAVDGSEKPRRRKTRNRPTHRAVKPANRKAAIISGAFRLLPFDGG